MESDFDYAASEDGESTLDALATDDQLESAVPVEFDPTASSPATAGSTDQPAPSNHAELDSAAVDHASQPFIGRWNQLISSTNWEKGRIIAEWRQNLIDQGAPATEFSDEAWAKRVGGVTAPHVGRLRRVYEAFGSQHNTYPGLYWSHFLAALDWDDAPLWLEGAMRSGWSISEMRDARWQAHGAVAADAPQASDIVSSDTDEDVVMPAQGGGSEGRFDKEPGDISAGPLPEGPDFGEEPGEPVAALDEPAEGDRDNLDGPGAQSLVQPFAGLPELPSDLSEALELFKLAIIRHKATGWSEIAPEVVHRALDGLKLLVNSRSE